MTFALLLSSLTMTLATRAPSVRARRGWLVATLALGVAFLAGAAIEYAHLLSAASPMGLTSDLFASTFYVVTGFHALHVLAGLIGVGFMLRAKFVRKPSKHGAILALRGRRLDADLLVHLSVAGAMTDGAAPAAARHGNLALGATFAALLGLTALELIVSGWGWSARHGSRRSQAC